MLQQSIRRHTTFTTLLTGCKCSKHLHIDEPCDIKFEQQYSKTKKNVKTKKPKALKVIIYGASVNYVVNDYKWYCNKIKSKKYSIFNTSHLHAAPDNYIKLITDKEKQIDQDIFIAGRVPVTADLIYLINDLVLRNPHCKSIPKWRQILISMFAAKAQSFLRSRNVDYDHIELTEIIRKNIIDRKHLQYIRNWLWRNSWTPFISMFLIYYYIS